MKVISKSHILYNDIIQEADILKELNHSGIPIIYDIEEDEQYSYIIEEYIQGKSLKIYRQEHSCLSQEEFFFITIQICKVIQYLHSIKPPILYLDLKPDNIIIFNNKIKLIDFGASKTSKDKQYMQGTVGYAAPEQYAGINVDPRTDIYSIGILMYYLQTGQLFHNSDMKYHIRYDKRLQKIISKCIQHDMHSRYSSINDLLDDLKTIHLQKKSHINNSQVVTIAIGGAQSRIGVTTFALILAKYFRDKGYFSIYLSENNELIDKIHSRNEGIYIRKGITEFNGIPIATMQMYEEIIKDKSIDIVISDMGIINQNNYNEYLTYNKKCMIMGTKLWELDYSEKVLELLEFQHDIYYLFNFINDKQYKEVLKSMSGKTCIHMPFMPNEYDKKKMDLLIEQIMSSICYPSIKKTKRKYQKR